MDPGCHSGTTETLPVAELLDKTKQGADHILNPDTQVHGTHRPLFSYVAVYQLG